MSRWLTICFLLVASCVTHAQEPRDWTYADSIAVRQFVREYQYPFWATVRQNPVVPSPDGRHFFFVSRHGDLARDCNVYELRVFSVEAVRRAFERTPVVAPAPVRITSLCSGSSYWSGMGNPFWDDNSRIVFAGQEGGAPRNILEFDIASGELRPLTHARGSGVSPSVNGISNMYGIANRSAIYIAVNSGPRKQGSLDDYPMIDVTNLQQPYLDDMRVDAGLFASYRGGPERLLQKNPEGTILSVSPDGRWAATLLRPKDGRSSRWARYAGSNPTSSWQVVLWNLETGRAVYPLDAPDGMAITNSSALVMPDNVAAPWTRMVGSDLLWSADSRRVILVNTTLPLDTDVEQRRGMSYIVDYEMATGRWAVLEPMADLKSGRRVSGVAWLKGGTELLVRHAMIPTGRFNGGDKGEPLEGTLYAFAAGKWVGRPVPSSVKGLPPAILPGATDVTFDGGLSVNGRESTDEPPSVVATMRGRELALTDPDPALRGVWRGAARKVEWTEPDGKVARGLLMLPRKHEKGAPALVIQAYYGSPEVFLPDGISPTAYAAQPLLAQGLAVLFVDIPAIDRRAVTDTTREGPAMVTRIDAAVGALAAQGLIDPARVGMIGFSRGGYVTYYAVTHPGKTVLGAAVVADAVTYTLAGQAQTYANVGSRSATRDLDVNEAMYGGPFDKATAAWLEHDPSLNVHRSRTPTLFAYNGRAQLYAAMDTFGFFRAARCPTAFLLFPDGNHQLARPRERQASMEATVDWMNFWLRGVEDGAAEKADMYVRWRKMREEQRKTALSASSAPTLQQ